MQAYILSLMIPAMALVFAAVFGALWWQDRSRRYILAYAGFFASMGIGITLNILYLGSAGSLGLLTYHLITMTGVVTLLWGIARSIDDRIPLGAYVIVVVVSGMIALAAGAVDDMETARKAQNVSAAVLFAFAAHSFWQSNRRRIADRALHYSLTLFSMFGFVTAFMHGLVRAHYGAESTIATVLVTLHIVTLAALIFALALSLGGQVVFEKMQRQRDAGSYDPLSGLRLRQKFEADAAKMMSRAIDEGRPVTLIVTDIDHFKEVNDTYGHTTGDAVIGSFGQHIASKLRPEDLPGRIGGEEFCVLVWGCEAEASAALAGRLREAVEAMEVTTEGGQISVTASFGVAQWDCEETYAHMFQRADNALYEAKHEGRNRVMIASDQALGARPTPTDVAELDVDAPCATRALGPRKQPYETARQPDRGVKLAAGAVKH